MSLPEGTQFSGTLSACFWRILTSTLPNLAFARSVSDGWRAEGGPMIPLVPCDSCWFAPDCFFRSSLYLILVLPGSSELTMRYTWTMIFNGFLKQIQIGQGIQSAKATSNVCSFWKLWLGKLPHPAEFAISGWDQQWASSKHMKTSPKSSHQSHEKRSSFQDKNHGFP